VKKRKKNDDFTVWFILTLNNLCERNDDHYQG